MKQLKKDKVKTKEEVMPLLNDLYYESIYAPLQSGNPEINYFYLCADLHQYQTGTVTIQPKSRKAPTGNLGTDAPTESGTSQLDALLNNLRG